MEQLKDAGEQKAAELKDSAEAKANDLQKQASEKADEIADKAKVKLANKKQLSLKRTPQRKLMN